jgi:hypothetical protein
MNIFGLNVDKSTDPTKITLYLKDEVGGKDNFLNLSDPNNETYKILYKLFEREIENGEAEVEIKDVHIPVVISGDNVKIDTDNVDLYKDKSIYEDVVRIKSEMDVDDKADTPEKGDDAPRWPRRKIEKPEYKDLSSDEGEGSEDKKKNDESSSDDFDPEEYPDHQDTFIDRRIYSFGRLKVLDKSALQPREIDDESVDFRKFDRVTLHLDQVTSGSYTVREKSEEGEKKEPKEGKVFGEPRNQSDVEGFIHRYVIDIDMAERLKKDLIERYPKDKSPEYLAWLNKGKRPKPNTDTNYSKFINKKMDMYVKNAHEYLQSPFVRGTGAVGYAQYISNLREELIAQYPRDDKKKNNKYHKWLKKIKKEDSDENYDLFIKKKMHKAEWLHSIADSIGSNPLAFWNASAGTHAANTHMLAIEDAIRGQQGVGIEVQTFLAPDTKIAEWYKYTVYVRNNDGYYNRVVFHIDAQERWYSRKDYDRDQAIIMKFLRETEPIRQGLAAPPEFNPPIVTSLKLTNPRHFAHYPGVGKWPFEKIGLPLQLRMPIPGLRLIDYTHIVEENFLKKKFGVEYYEVKVKHEEKSKVAETVCEAVKSGNIQVIAEEFRINPNSINYCNSKGEYPLLLALDPKNPKIALALALIKHGANLHVTDGEGNNALHLAIKAWAKLSKTAGYEEKQEFHAFIEELIWKDSSLTSKLSEDINYSKQTPMDLARQLLVEGDPIREILKHAEDSSEDLSPPLKRMRTEPEKKEKEEKEKIDSDKDLDAMDLDEVRSPDISSHVSDQQTISQGIPGLAELKIPGDGHCLYNAVAIHLGVTQEKLREEVANYIESHIEDLRDFLHTRLNQSPEDYIRGIREGREWAAHAEIEVLMRLFDRPIVAIGLDGRIQDLSVLDRRGEPIFVLYNGHNHFDAFLRTEEIPKEVILEHLKQFNEHLSNPRDGRSPLDSRADPEDASAQRGQKRDLKREDDASDGVSPPRKKARTDTYEREKEKKEQKVEGKETARPSAQQKHEKEAERRLRESEKQTQFHDRTGSHSSYGSYSSSTNPASRAAPSSLDPEKKEKKDTGSRPPVTGQGQAPSEKPKVTSIFSSSSSSSSSSDSDSSSQGDGSPRRFGYRS